MKVKGATLEDLFDYLIDVAIRKFLLKEGKRHIYELFENGIQRILNLMKILIFISIMMDC